MATLPTPVRCTVASGERPVPLSLWLPQGAPCALVLCGHGGSGHKESPAVLAIAEKCVPLGWAVAAIDGPVHGDRRAGGPIDASVQIVEFRAAWQRGIGRFEMADDWRQALAHLQRDQRLATVPVAYIGVSMGTAYGIPFLAQQPAVRAAVLGLWGLNDAASAHLAASAGQIVCPILFSQQLDDAAFDRAGVAALFDAIGTPDKKLLAYPGPHLELSGERLDDAIDYLKKRLCR